MPKTIDINLDALHPGQQIVSDQRKRFNVLSCGRRWGKTDFTYHLLAEICKYNLMNDISQDMGYMSPTYKNLEPTWRKFKRLFGPLITGKSEQQHTAEIMNSFLIEFWSLDNPENIRGRQYKRVIIDEAALILALKEILKLIVLPTIGDLVGDLWMFSTPRGFNDFNYYYKNGQNPLLVDWASWIMPTSTNPFFPKEELESQRALISIEEFQQEWEGKFVALGNSPFDTDYFKFADTLDDALAGELPLYQIRYWDIADSKDGDRTASSRMTITLKPEFIISNPVAWPGLWGDNYSAIKAVILSEPNIVHLFETEGVGGIAFQMVNMDSDLAHITKLPAGRAFTNVGKMERAQIWAMELRNRRMTVVKDVGYQDLLDEVAGFPGASHDDQVDGISGNIMAFILIFGGWAKLLKSKQILPKQVRDSGGISQEKEEMMVALADEWSM